MTEFWLMGGYGGYVWSSVAVTLGVLCYLGLAAWRRHRRLLNQLEQYYAEEQRRESC